MPAAPGTDASPNSAGVDARGLAATAQPLAWLGEEVLGPALRLVFQNLVLEADARVLEASQVRRAPGRPRERVASHLMLRAAELSLVVVASLCLHLLPASFVCLYTLYADLSK